MERSLVMTVIGADRPGLVEALSDAVADQGGNWLESRLAHLGGQFAGVIRVACNPSVASVLEARVREAVGGDLRIEIAHGDSVEVTPVGNRLRIDLVANDRPGIVNQLTRAIRKVGGNIEELETGLESAAMSGHPVFQAKGELLFPSEISAEEVQLAIEAVSEDLQVTVS